MRRAHPEREKSSEADWLSYWEGLRAQHGHPDKLNAVLDRFFADYYPSHDE